MLNNSERPVDALAVKKVTYSLSDNLKSKDASASKKEHLGLPFVFLAESIRMLFSDLLHEGNHQFIQFFNLLLYRRPLICKDILCKTPGNEA